MDNKMKVLLLAGGTVLLIGMCVITTPLILPGLQDMQPTPTFTPGPTATWTPSAPDASQADATSTALAITTLTAQAVIPLQVPSPFDIMLDFTNGTCGGGDATYAYTITIDGLVMTMIQTDANITTLGTYDPDTGAFSTSADVGPGVETYTGVIVYDGQTVLISGLYGWSPDSGNPCGADIMGETIP